MAVHTRARYTWSFYPFFNVATRFQQGYNHKLSRKRIKSRSQNLVWILHTSLHLDLKSEILVTIPMNTVTQSTDLNVIENNVMKQADKSYRINYSLEIWNVQRNREAAAGDTYKSADTNVVVEVHRWCSLLIRGKLLHAGC